MTADAQHGLSRPARHWRDAAATPAAFDLPVRKRLSYKQARNTALLTLVLGLFLSSAQIFIDLLQLDHKTDILVYQVLRTLEQLAAEASYTVDQALATRVLDSLFQYRPIIHAEIIDDVGGRLAVLDRPLSKGYLRWLVNLLLPHREYVVPLVIERHGAQPVGELRAVIDHNLVTREFFQRAALTLGAGVFWAVALAGILVALFHVSLTKPFLQLARTITGVDPARPGERVLPAPDGHNDDELGLITQTTNDLLRQFAESLERREAAEARLIDREARLRGIMENVADGIVTVDHNYHVESMNRAALDLFGCEAQEEVGRPLSEFLAESEDWRGVLRFLTRCLVRPHRRGGEAMRQELKVCRRDGTLAEVSFGIRLMRHGDRVTFICVVQDITARKRAERALRDSEERLKLAVIATRSGVWDLNLASGAFFWSREFKELLGYGDDELPSRRSVWESLVHPDDLPWCKTLADRFLNGEVPDYQPVYRMRRKDGSWLWIEDKAQCVRDENGNAIRFTGTMADVTERKRFEEQLMYMATHDPLTRLPNRTLLQDRLSHAITVARRKGTVLGLLHIDLDRFKLINDSLGHQVGDQLLRGVAETLSLAARLTDTVGRLGGDEFLVIAEDLDEPQDAGRIAGTLLHALTRAYTVEGHQLFVTPSIGIAIHAGDNADMPGLLRHADTALHSAKSGGGNTYRFFIPEMNKEAVARLALERALREAVDNEQFQLHYQVKADVDTLKPVGLEALIRWRHPEEGFISPAVFIPVAEETGLIVTIGEWVMRTALEQIRSWRERGIAALPVAVNVSVRQLTTGTPVATVADCLMATGVSPDLLEIEITESVMMNNLAAIVETLRELRNLGLKISVDDFGTGYSSLSYLRRLPITALKVDRSFINDVTGNADDAAIAATIIAMGRQLGLTVIAEGIETAEQLHFLQRHRCDELQGFYIARPMPAEALEARFVKDGQWVAGELGL